jgi:cytochrome P450
MTAPGTLDRPLAPVSLRALKDVDPYPAYAAIRAAGPVLWDEGMEAWLVSPHDLCTIVLRREDLYAEPTGSLPGAAEIVGRRDIRSLLGDQHETLHRAVSHAWRPDPLAPLAAAAVRPLVAERLAGLAPRPTFELFGEFARLLPISVISRVLGLPDADTSTLDMAKTWMEAVLAWRHSYGEDPELVAAAITATKQLEPLVIDTVRDRRDHPRDDGISLLWEAGRRVAPDWGEQDVLDNAKFMYEGGSETTAFLITTATHHLLAFDPDERPATIGDRERLGLFLEEVLRHSSVVHLRMRRTTQDTQLGGQPIAAGERVIAIMASANRDPERWGPDPDALDPARPKVRSHLGFSVGPRHCAGGHLARLEATEAVSGLFRAFPDLARAPGAPATVPIGFVSRVWRPVELAHAPVAPDVVRARVADAPWADPAEELAGGGYSARGGIAEARGT